MKNKKNPACQAKAELMQEIESLQQALETAHSNFENVCDPDLIDSYIYEINALSFRYKYCCQVQHSDKRRIYASNPRFASAPIISLSVPPM
ncbi:MAG: YaaL family protein [Clostridium sp.]